MGIFAAAWRMKQLSSVATPPANTDALYFKTDGKLYAKNSAGTERLIEGAAVHGHALTDANITGTLALAKGGTGGADAATARANLGVGSDAASGTASMRTLGTGATQAAAGNDSRLSDARPPTAHGHAINDIVNLQTTLNGKAEQWHVHDSADILYDGTVMQYGINLTDALDQLSNGKATTSHSHGLGGGEITGTLPIGKGGTGATDAATARANLNASPIGHTHSSSTLVAELRAHVNATTGGSITVDASGYVNWSQRIIVIANGNGAHFSTSGYFDIGPITPGTSVTGVAGAGTRDATAAGVQLTAWEALYYILPIGSGYGYISTNWRVVAYSSALEVPENWLLVAVRNGEGTTPIRFCTGISLGLGQTWNATNTTRAVNVYSGGWPTRPAATLVEWMGPVSPGASMQIGDTWTDTS